MSEGHAADILCGVLNHLSRERPLELWERVEQFLDIDAVLQNCKHVSRLATLHGIAERAGLAGSASGRGVVQSVESLLRPGAIVLPKAPSKGILPAWAKCIKPEWEALREIGVVTGELAQTLADKMKEFCDPLDVEDTCNLEEAVAQSFRERADAHLNRWESKVRFALNCVLVPYVSVGNFAEVASSLRIYNPALPEQSLSLSFQSTFKDILAAIEEGKDFSAAIGTSDSYFLNYCEVGEIGKGEIVRLNVVAVVLPSSSRDRSFFLPRIESIFSSRSLPDYVDKSQPHETCFSLLPVYSFFGACTPGFPMPTFKNMISATESDFQRINWRIGRSTEPECSGNPSMEGCLLSVKKSAVNMPKDKKLAWIVRVDGQIKAMIDAKNNRLSFP